MLGIFLTGVLSRLFFNADSGLAWLVAPMGASAVLLFAVPASPLAQPWPFIGGNLISALVGVVCAEAVGFPAAAASIAVGVSIAAMFALRCVHPPGGAMALSTALAAPAIAQHGYAFVLSPIVINSVLLLAAAIAYNKLCGRRYPHFAHDHGNQHHTADAPPSERLGVTSADLNAVLKQYNEVLDISRDDLEEIFLRTEMHAYQRRFGQATCADIMSRDVVKVEFGTELQLAWRLLREHRIKALPVVNRFNRVIGIVTQYDFIKQCAPDTDDGFAERLNRLLRRTPGTHSDKAEVVGQIMTAPVRTAAAGQPVASLVSLFSDSSLHHLPVVDGNQRLVGIVTQSDLIGALYRLGLEQKSDQATGPIRRMA